MGMNAAVCTHFVSQAHAVASDTPADKRVDIGVTRTPALVALLGGHVRVALAVSHTHLKPKETRRER